MVVNYNEDVAMMTLRRRIRILISELSKKGKNVKTMSVHYIKIDDENWERVGSEYELYERLVEEWEES